MCKDRFKEGVLCCFHQKEHTNMFIEKLMNKDRLEIKLEIESRVI